MAKDKTLYVCPRCDRVYFSVTREKWNKDPNGYNRRAVEAKRKHLCPWQKKKNNK